MTRKSTSTGRKKAPQKRRVPKLKSEPTSAMPTDPVLTVEMVEAAPSDIEVGKSAPIVLPENLDFSAATELKELLLTRRGEALAIDAGQVRRTGMQAVQVLLAAAKTWRADGQSYAITNPAAEFLDTVALVGLSREYLLIEGIF